MADSDHDKKVLAELVFIRNLLLGLTITAGIFILVMVVAAL